YPCRRRQVRVVQLVTLLIQAITEVGGRIRLVEQLCAGSDVVEQPQPPVLQHNSRSVLMEAQARLPTALDRQVKIHARFLTFVRLEFRAILQRAIQQEAVEEPRGGRLDAQRGKGVDIHTAHF